MPIRKRAVIESFEDANRVALIQKVNDYTDKMDKEGKEAYSQIMQDMRTYNWVGIVYVTNK